MTSRSASRCSPDRHGELGDTRPIQRSDDTPKYCSPRADRRRFTRLPWAAPCAGPEDPRPPARPCGEPLGREDTSSRAPPPASRCHHESLWPVPPVPLGRAGHRALDGVRTRGPGECCGMRDMDARVVAYSATKSLGLSRYTQQFRSACRRFCNKIEVMSHNPQRLTANEPTESTIEPGKSTSEPRNFRKRTQENLAFRAAPDERTLSYTFVAEL
jgi:hypothetical protein